MDWLSIVAMILSLLGNLFITIKNIIGFPIWIISNILWIIVNLQNNTNYSQIIMFIAYAITNIYGWYIWNKKK